MEDQKILVGLLSKALKLDNGKIAEILNSEKTDDEKLNEFLEIDAERIEKLKTSASGDKMTFQERYAKTKKEVLEALETQLKENYNIDSDKTGLDLIGEIVSENLKTNGGAEITEDDVKKHPTYHAAVRDYKKQLADKEAEHTTKLNEIETNQKKAVALSSVKEKANTLLSTLDPILSQNANVANTIKNNFLRELEGYDYDVQEDGSIIVTKDGKTIDDKHGHAKAFDDLVKETAGNWFDFKGNNGGENAGNKNKDGDNGGVIPKFKNQSEVDAYMMNDAIALDDRLKAVDDWKASQV